MTSPGRDGLPNITKKKKKPRSVIFLTVQISLSPSPPSISSRRSPRSCARTSFTMSPRLAVTWAPGKLTHTHTRAQTTPNARSSSHPLSVVWLSLSPFSKKSKLYLWSYIQNREEQNCSFQHVTSIDGANKFLSSSILIIILT